MVYIKLFALVYDKYLCFDGFELGRFNDVSRYKEMLFATVANLDHELQPTVRCRYTTALECE